METGTSEVVNLDIENAAPASGNPEDHEERSLINTCPEENESDSDQVDEKDVLVFLRKKLDEKSLLEKITYLRSEWFRKDDLFDIESKGAFVFKFLLWVLR